MRQRPARRHVRPPRRRCRRPSRSPLDVLGVVPRAASPRPGPVRRDRRGPRRGRVRPRRRRCCSSARTSAATTRSTRWSARCCSPASCPATGLGLFVSGRASVEMVQKAWAAGFGTVVAVSAPTALAVRRRPPRQRRRSPASSAATGSTSTRPSASAHLSGTTPAR